MLNILTQEERPKIPISSLIDVVFLLIMFFIVTSVIEQEAIDDEVILAKAEDLQPLKNKTFEKIIVDITEDKRFKVKNRVFSLKAIVERITNLTKKNKKIPIVIRVDQNTPFEGVDKIFKEIKLLKLSNIRFSVEGLKK